MPAFECTGARPASSHFSCNIGGFLCRCFLLACGGCFARACTKVSCKLPCGAFGRTLAKPVPNPCAFLACREKPAPLTDDGASARATACPCPESFPALACKLASQPMHTAAARP